MPLRLRNKKGLVMPEEKRCCEALRRIEEKARNAIESIDGMSPAKRDDLFDLRMQLESIREICEGARGAPA